MSHRLTVSTNVCKYIPSILLEIKAHTMTVRAQIDPKPRSNRELENLIDNYVKAGLKEQAQPFVIERVGRGGRMKSSYKSMVKWNAEEIKTILAPFEDLSRNLVDSSRVFYAEAGGRVYKDKESLDRLSHDSYTAIKNGRVNATFGCRITQIGDEPEFVLIIYYGAERGETSYTFAGLDEALARWEELVSLALNPSTPLYVHPKLAAYIAGSLRPFIDGFTYTWKLNEDDLTSFGISLPDDCGSFPGDRTLALRRCASEWWASSTTIEKQRFSTWLLREWGGIKRNSATKIAAYVEAADSANPKTNFDGISSLSKVLSFSHPSRFAIYDSRVSAALNAIQITSNLDPMDCVAFPYPPGRNTALFGSLESPGFTDLHPCRSLQKRGFLNIQRKDVYAYYMELLRSVSTILDCSIARVEMALFAQAIHFTAGVGKH